MFQLFKIDNRQFAIVTDKKLPRALHDAIFRPRWTYVKYALIVALAVFACALLVWLILPDEETKARGAVIILALGILVSTSVATHWMSHEALRRDRIRRTLINDDFEEAHWNWAVMSGRNIILKAIEPVTLTTCPDAIAVIVQYIEDAQRVRAEHNLMYSQRRGISAINSLNIELRYELAILELAGTYTERFSQYTSSEDILKLNLSDQQDRVMQLWRNGVYDRRRRIIYDLGVSNRELSDLDSRLANFGSKKYDLALEVRS